MKPTQQPELKRNENEMKNFILTVWNANGTTTTWNLGRWNWDANETQCGDDVKRVAFSTLETQMSQYYWSYQYDGWIEGNAKNTDQQIRAFLSMGLTDRVL